MFTYTTGETKNYVIISKVSHFTKSSDRPVFFIHMDNGETLTVPNYAYEDFFKRITSFIIKNQC